MFALILSVVYSTFPLFLLLLLPSVAYPRSLRLLPPPLSSPTSKSSVHSFLRLPKMALIHSHFYLRRRLLLLPPFFLSSNLVLLACSVLQPIHMQVQEEAQEVREALPEF